MGCGNIRRLTEDDKSQLAGPSDGRTLVRHEDRKVNLAMLKRQFKNCVNIQSDALHFQDTIFSTLPSKDHASRVGVTS